MNELQRLQAQVLELSKALERARTREGISSAFVSTEQTGTGGSQSIAHGLGMVPTYVLVTITEASGAIDVAEGVHTSTNVVVTVTSGVKYKVLAIV